MLAPTRLFVGTSAIIFCLVNVVKNDAALNRSGVNCVLAPPGAQSDASSSSDQTAHADSHSSADDVSSSENLKKDHPSGNASGSGQSQASSSSSQSSSAKLLTKSGKSGNEASRSSSTKTPGKNAAKSIEASSNSKDEGAIIPDQEASSAQLLGAMASDAAPGRVIPKPEQNKTSKISSGSSAIVPSSSTNGASSSSAKNSSKKSGFEIPGAVLVANDGSENFGTKFDNSKWLDRAEKNDQGNVWKELDTLRGKETMSAGEIQDLLAKAVPGKDYPTYASIPTTSFRCENVNQAGFYADPETRCQVIRRCDINGLKWNYLCPNATLFNQITLTCDWYFNIDCSKAVQFYDYSNSRLYHSDWQLLDTPGQDTV